MVYNRGLFIVFEGIDGSGSSTQARLLYDYLSSNSHYMHKVILTTEPTSGLIGSIIKSIMQGRLITSNQPKIDDRLLAYLFAADRHDHLYNAVNGIMKMLDDQCIVISTRYYLSSLAYHVSNDNDYQFVKLLNENFPMPDITFYLDCPIEVAIKRLEQRNHLEKYENIEKLKIVYSNYQRAIKDYSGLIHLLDGRDSIKKIHKKIVFLLKELMDQKYV